MEQIISNSDKSREAFVQEANQVPALVPFVVQEILKQAYTYEERTETVEETLELTKLYPFKISIESGRNKLVIYREREEEVGHSGKLGFHINPYNFDSADERDLFRYLRDIFETQETVKDVYFTGGATDTSHNDFYFEYWSPEKQRIARYFPDFLIETSKGRFLVVEVKSVAERMEYEANKKLYDGKREKLTNEVFAKEIGFLTFQEINKDFEYRIVFDASLQREQEKLLEDVHSLV